MSGIDTPKAQVCGILATTIVAPMDQVFEIIATYLMHWHMPDHRSSLIQENALAG